MKKIMDKLKNKIKYNKKIMLFLIIIVIIGIISGSFLCVILNSSDKALVQEHIKSFIENINSNNLNYVDSLKNSVLINTILTLGIWILGISVIGLLVVILLIFWKSFTLAFTIAGFIITYNLKGLLCALIYIFPHLIINLLIIMYLGSYSIKFSMLIIKCMFNKVNLDIHKLMKVYTKVLLFSFSTIIITSLYESFVTPFLLKIIASILF